MKTKLKVTTALLTSLFLVSIIAVSTPAIVAKPDGRLMINIMAKGDDGDIGLDLGIYRATTLIVGKIKFDEASGEGLGRIEFHVKIYEIESGEKVYTIKGKLKDGAAIPEHEFICTVRGVTWINLWFVMGAGMIKTTDIDLEIVYRGQPIALPNTGGKWSPATVIMMVSPYGDYKVWIDGYWLDGVWIEGYWVEGSVGYGWASAGIIDFDGLELFGGVTVLTKYMEI